jgi:hypothetical protein
MCVIYRVKILVLVSAAYFYHFLHLLCAEIIYPDPLFGIVKLLFGYV